MDIIYRIDRFGSIRQERFDNANQTVLVKSFNQDYNHKDGIKILLARCTLAVKVNYAMIQGVLEDMGINGVHIKTTDDLNMQILNYFDEFWEAVQAQKKYSLIYCRSILETYPKLMTAKYGVPVALVSQDDDIPGLKNIGEDRQLNGSFHAWLSDGVLQDKRLCRKLIKRIEDDAEMFRQISSGVQTG